MPTRRSMLVTSIAAGVMGCQTTPDPLITSRSYIYLNGLITADLGYKLQTLIEDKRKVGITEFYILISSDGGLALHAMQIYDLLMRLRLAGNINIITHNVGLVASAAVLIFMAGQTRLMNKNAAFLVHAAHSETDAPTKANDMNAEYLDLRQVDDVTTLILKRNTTMPADLAEQYAHDRYDHIIKADDALRFGFVQRVVDFTVPPTAVINGFWTAGARFEGQQNGPEIPVEFHTPGKPTIVDVVGPRRMVFQIYVP